MKRMNIAVGFFVLACSVFSFSIADAAPGRGLLRAVSPDDSFRMASRETREGFREVKVQFRGGKTLNGRYSQEGELLRYWISEVAPQKQMLTEREKNELRRFLVHEGNELQRQDSLLASFIEMNANFFPANERITPFDAKRAFGRRNFVGRSYTMICEFIGLEYRAFYTVNGEERTAVQFVGEERTECRGRCGTGCEQMGQYRYHQYTRECFNHDMCRTDTNTNLGECEDEFWAAAYGYAVAPECY